MQRLPASLRAVGASVATLLLLAACAPVAAVAPSDPTAPASPSVPPGPPAAAAASGASTPVAGATSCRSGDPLANVYHPDRLRVIDACKTVAGTVAFVWHEDDGDYHVGLRLDAPFSSLLNSGNLFREHGDLVAEIVPADEGGCTPGAPPRPAHGSYDYGVCTGADMHPPELGIHVAVTGPYVLDMDHGWMEIHPVGTIRALQG